MAVKSPLCIYSGKYKELQSGDTIANTASQGSYTNLDIRSSIPDVNTLLLAPFQNANGATFVWDEGNTNRHQVMAATGSPTVSTSVKPTGWKSSLYFDGNDVAYFQNTNVTAYNNTSDFTIDLHFNFSSLPADGTVKTLVSRFSSVFGYQGWMLYVLNSSGTYYLTYYVYWAGGSEGIARTVTLSTNTWYHVELGRSGNNHYMFLDGTQLGAAATLSHEPDGAPHTVVLGAFDDGGYTSFFTGYMAEFRYSNICRHTSNFTPETLPYNSNTTGVTITADSIVLYDSSAAVAKEYLSINQAVNIFATGAGGLDTGSLATSATWYYIWLIGKSDGTIAALFSTSATAPTMPAGYSYKRRVSCVYTGGNGFFWPMIQSGGHITQCSGFNILAAGTATTITIVAIGNSAPPIITSVDLAIFINPTYHAGELVYTYVQSLDGFTPGAPIASQYGGTWITYGSADRILPILTNPPAVMYYSGYSYSQVYLYVEGFTIPI